MPVTVVREEGEDYEDFVDRFLRKVSKSGVLREVRDRRYYVSRGEKRRLAKEKAIRLQKQRQGR